jgi:hypothetical protein
VCALSDALQAIVEFEPIAIWAREFCVEISQGEAFVLRRLKKKRDARQSNWRQEKRSMRVGIEAGGASGVTAERLFVVSDVAGRI